MRAMSGAAPGRGDPAGTTLRYRLRRLWRRRSVRRAVQVQIPAMAVALAAVILGADPAVHAAVSSQVHALRETLTTRPEFAVTRIEITGASPDVEAEMRAALIDVPGASSLALDAAALRRRMERLGWIARAVVSLEAPATLRIAVTERTPAAVWRIDGEPWLIDAGGARIAALFRRGEFAGLPLVVGEGADGAVEEALALVAALGPLKPRLRGLVRVGQRRWDVVLDHGQRVMLPMDDPVGALIDAVAWNGRDAVLDRDIAALDLRLAHRPTLRLTDRALETMLGVGTAVAARRHDT